MAEINFSKIEMPDEQAKNAAKKAPAKNPNALADLQKSIAESKATSKAKSVEIPTIALENAVNTGDKAAIIAAAKAVAEAQGGSASTKAANAIAAVQAASPQPVLGATNIARGDQVKWVGGVNGSWQVIKGPGSVVAGSTGGSPDLSGLLGLLGGTGGSGGSGALDAIQALLAQQSAAQALAQQQAAAATAAQQKAERQSAYDLLYSQFAQYGLEALVTPLKGLIESGVSPSEFTLRLRETDAYKKRFAANASRIQKGLRALSEAEYIQLEDQYQNVMRNYGLPADYYARGEMGVQPGFEKFIAGDVSAAELEDRIQTAQNRVINAAPEVGKALREFYPDITNGDILAYALDPDKALTTIKRKIGAAEIGAGAAMAGLSTGLARAEELQRYGVTGEAARAGYQTIGSLLPRATQLGDIYAKMGMGPYTQTTAESEVFGTPGAIEAANKRRKLTELEQAQFSGSSGATGGALARERAGQF